MTPYARCNLVLAKLLDHMTHVMFAQGSVIRFEDLKMPPEFERFFDGCSIWGLHEAIFLCGNPDSLSAGASETSYAQIQSSKITTLGMRALSLYMASGSGDLMGFVMRMKYPVASDPILDDVKVASGSQCRNVRV